MRGGVTLAQLKSSKVPVKPTFVATEFGPNQRREFQQAAAKLSASLASANGQNASQVIKSAHEAYAATPQQLVKSAKIQQQYTPKTQKQQTFSPPMKH